MDPETLPPEAAATPPATVTAALELVPDAPSFVLNDPAALAARLARYTEARKVLVDWIMSQLVPGIDFLLIHRKVGPRGQKRECSRAGNMVDRVCAECGGKSTLAKPGSEKICGLLQLRPRFRRDLENWEMLGSEPGVIALVCELVTASGDVVAEGRGGRHRDQDFGEINRTLKMCQKSAQTDAVLRLAGLSEIFTQDLEDLPGYVGGDDSGSEFQPPRAKSGAAPTPTSPAPRNLEAQLKESVDRARAVRAATGRPAPAATRPAPRPTGRAVPRPQAGSAAGQTPPDALSPARINRLMALLHEAIRGAEVPEEEHEAIFGSAKAYLTDWVGTTQGRERISDCSWRAYDELCAQIPAAVDAALGGQGPAPRPRPRLVQKRTYSAPRPFARRGY